MVEFTWNLFEFIKDPDNENILGYYLCQDCRPKYRVLDRLANLIDRNHICRGCGSHTLGPFKDDRECRKVFYALNHEFEMFEQMQEEDKVEMPGYQEAREKGMVGY